MPLRLSPTRGAGSISLSAQVRGPTGPQGVQGNIGPAGTIEVGNVTSLPAGNTPTVTNVGTPTAAVLNFGLTVGNTGATGTAATIAVGTVTTLAAGASATVTNVGTSAAAVFNFGIPQGVAGALSASGTPTAGQFGVWTNATTQKGVSITGLVKGNGASDPAAAVAGTDYLAPAAIGVTVQAYDASTLKANVTATISVGFSLTPYSAGTKSSGTYTPAPADGNYQYATNGGAHTLAAPSSDCAIDILYTNNGSAGSITFSGFTVASGNVGDALTTTNTHKFIISIRRINGTSTYLIKALQ